MLISRQRAPPSSVRFLLLPYLLEDWKGTMDEMIASVHTYIIFYNMTHLPLNKTHGRIMKYLLYRHRNMAELWLVGASCRESQENIDNIHTLGRAGSPNVQNTQVSP